MISLENYIVPIMRQAQVGCGFFIENLLFTAGHVVENSDTPLTVWFEGKKILLDTKNAIKVCCTKEINEDENCADFAVFRVDNVDSPLRFADYKPPFGQELLCVTYNTIVAKDESCDTLTIFACKEKKEKVQIPAIVSGETCGNYFVCNTKTVLKEGNSGSPLLDSENRVVGVLCGGTSIPECCIFQYVKLLKDSMI